MPTARPPMPTRPPCPDPPPAHRPATVPAAPAIAVCPPGLHRLLRLAIGLLALTLTAGLILAAADPQRLADWGREDGPIENLTAAGFALAALRAGCCLVAERRLRPRLVLLGLFALLCALDELSWGERLFGLRMPQLAGVQIDAAHDLVDLLVAVGQRHPWKLLALLAPLLAVLLWVGHARRRTWLALLQRLDWPGAGTAGHQLMVWMTLLLTTALAIDVTHTAQAALQTLEETLELHASLAAVLAAGVLGGPAPRSRTAPTTAPLRPGSPRRPAATTGEAAD